MKTDPDRKLVMQAKRGSKRALARLVLKYQDQTLGLAYDYLADYNEARAAAQDVFKKVIDHLNRFEEQAGFSTWLHRITVNHCLEIRRKKQRTPLLREREYRGMENLAQHRFPADMAVPDRAGLSERQQTAVILRYFQDLSVPEIAAIMDRTETTVRIHLYRALNRLRQDPE